MPFVGIQEENLYNSILKTWIKFLKDTGDFTGIGFKVATPDTDIELKLPLIVLKRVSNDTWSISRNGGYYGTSTSDENSIQHLEGYVFESMIQFDILATTTTECNKLQGLIHKAFKPSLLGGRTHIPIRDFIGTDNVGTDTNLQLKFFFYKDIDGTMLPSFDPNLHQTSVSVKFLVDYLTEVSNDKILDTTTVYNININM